ncbi:cytochrome d ubiquinol oxidase subunit II [Legionella sp. W05-934-2]|jgi:cytochrome d ubiquinol oxidase subunit II|uniref:cytochrome d ubiquinol oxidase subunit II n=1 Tax=Legionella sp. W05-934-2 TaxID=1198649 RepID=UPI003461CE9D
MPIDYETLRVIWWVLLGILLIGFAIMDGFDLGVASLLPFLGKSDIERRIIINSIGPTWEGNQVWFILGGGAIFAAWPMLYALSFSGLYLAMLCLLLALILRPVGFKYRSKLASHHWRNCWDWALFIGGFVPALLCGVAVGNVIQGVPFTIDDNLRVFYEGTFIQLLNPFALLCGLLSVSMLVMHGACFLNIKTESSIQQRAIIAAKYFAIITTFLFILGGIWVYFAIPGYDFINPMIHDGPSNPLMKKVAIVQGAWLFNYKTWPVLMLIPLIGVLMPLFVLTLADRYAKNAFLCSSLAIFSIIATVGVSMFPFILPSSLDASASLTVWDSSSSQLTLFIMLVATVVFLPIVLLYTAWVYKVLSGKVTAAIIEESSDSVY